MKRARLVFAMAIAIAMLIASSPPKASYDKVQKVGIAQSAPQSVQRITSTAQDESNGITTAQPVHQATMEQLAQVVDQVNGMSQSPPTRQIGSAYQMTAGPANPTTMASGEAHRARSGPLQVGATSTV